MVLRLIDVGIIRSGPGSSANALGPSALPRTGTYRIGKLQLAYDSIKVARKIRIRVSKEIDFTIGSNQDTGTNISP